MRRRVCLCGEDFFWRFTWRSHVRTCKRLENPRNAAEAFAAMVIWLGAEGVEAHSRYGDAQQTLKAVGLEEVRP